MASQKRKEAADYERLVEQESLILEATEAICEVMEGQDSERITKKELARRVGCGKSHITQLLSGDRNLTLRTLADLATALGHRVELRLAPIPTSGSVHPEQGQEGRLREALKAEGERRGCRFPLIEAALGQDAEEAQ